MTRNILVFILLSLLASVLVYRDALWGESLLAPLDIAPSLFENYRYMEPSGPEIPANHHIIDQLTYDLPLQYVIYKAYERGEIPWWDPYTCGGRPLLADAHINGTDPVRLLCYAALPFELGYNWNYILRGILTGLGMFLLLRYLGVSLLASSLLAITYQFGGWFTLHFGHPWIQGSFLYYPYIWLAWAGALTLRPALQIAVSSLLVALVFYSGNLQSHTYIVLFAALFMVASLWKERSRFLRTAGIIAASGVLGAALATPVLLNQVEFFLVGLRDVSSPFSWKAIGNIPALLAAFYPWMLGSFRTIDAGQLLGASGMSYYLFCGPAVFLIAFHYLWKGGDEAGEKAVHAKAMGLLLIGAFLFIAATPLLKYFYLRSAALAGMGLIVLAGLGVKQLSEKGLSARKAVIFFTAVYAACALTSSVAAWFVYPRFETAFLKKALERDRENGAFPSFPALRTFQVHNFANEASLFNVEAAVALVVVLGGGVLLMRGGHCRSRGRLVVFLAAGLVPLLHYHNRFRPKHDISLWHRLVEGGAAQKAIKDELGPHRRLEERPDQPFTSAVFPNAMAALYGVHVFHGYSALHPKALFYLNLTEETVPADSRADLNLAERSDAPASQHSSVRFRSNGMVQPLIRDEGLNQVSVILPEGIEFPVIRTDTDYPGWRATAGGGEVVSRSYPPAFSAIDEVAGSEISYSYQPTYLVLSLKIAGGTMLLWGGLLLAGILRKPRYKQMRKAVKEGPLPVSGAA